MNIPSLPQRLLVGPGRHTPLSASALPAAACEPAVTEPAPAAGQALTAPVAAGPYAGAVLLDDATLLLPAIRQGAPAPAGQGDDGEPSVKSGDEPEAAPAMEPDAGPASEGWPYIESSVADWFGPVNPDAREDAGGWPQAEAPEVAAGELHHGEPVTADVLRRARNGLKRLPDSPLPAAPCQQPLAYLRVHTTAGSFEDIRLTEAPEHTRVAPGPHGPLYELALGDGSYLAVNAAFADQLLRAVLPAPAVLADGGAA